MANETKKSDGTEHYQVMTRLSLQQQFELSVVQLIAAKRFTQIITNKSKKVSIPAR